MNAASTILQQGQFEEKFLGEHPCYRVVVWCGVNRMIFPKHPLRHVAVIKNVYFALILIHCNGLIVISVHVHCVMCSPFYTVDQIWKKKKRQMFIFIC